INDVIRKCTSKVSVIDQKQQIYLIGRRQIRISMQACILECASLIPYLQHIDTIFSIFNSPRRQFFEFALLRERFLDPPKLKKGALFKAPNCKFASQHAADYNAARVVTPQVEAVK